MANTTLIDEDTTRRIALNTERNPRETIYNEATSTINPLTGRVYDDQFYLAELEKISYFPINDDLKNIEYIPKNLSSNIDFKPRTNDFIEYQLALAKMDVREGKMPKAEFFGVRRNINQMIERMNDSNVPLAMLSSVTALNAAIEQIQREIPRVPIISFKMDDIVSRVTDNKDFLRYDPEGHKNYIYLKRY